MPLRIGDGNLQSMPQRRKISRQMERRKSSTAAQWKELMEDPSFYIPIALLYVMEKLIATRLLKLEANGEKTTKATSQKNVEANDENAEANGEKTGKVMLMVRRLIR